MRKSEEITLAESRDAEIQLGDLVSFLGELTMHLGSISRFFQSKTGEQEATVVSLRSKTIQDEIEKSFLAIGREVYASSTTNPEPLKVSEKIGSLFSRVEILQEIMDEINGKTPIEKPIPEASKEVPAPPAVEKPEKPEKPEEKPALKAEGNAPDEAGEKPPVKVEEEAAAAEKEKEVAPESSS
jgi:outer membrane biosynthesis protein TonB